MDIYNSKRFEITLTILPVYIHFGLGKNWNITQKLKTAFDN